MRTIRNVVLSPANLESLNHHFKDEIKKLRAESSRKARIEANGLQKVPKKLYPFGEMQASGWIKAYDHDGRLLRLSNSGFLAAKGCKRLRPDKALMAEKHKELMAVVKTSFEQQWICYNPYHMLFETCNEHFETALEAVEYMRIYQKKIQWLKNK